MKSMIGSFLSSVWKQGGLASAVPEYAFAVQVGLGETMTQNDVLNGIMRIIVLVAITRPAEFIEITFQRRYRRVKAFKCVNQFLFSNRLKPKYYGRDWRNPKPKYMAGS